MTGYEVRLAPEAWADLKAIKAYLVREAGEDIADRFSSRVFDRLDVLVMFPKSGRVERRFVRPFRLSAVNPWIIIYEERAADRVIVVRRIVDGRRDLTKLSFKSSPP